MKIQSSLTAVLCAAASMLLLTAEPMLAQDKEPKKKGKGGLFKMFEAKSKKLDPETQKKLESVAVEAQKLLDENEDAEDAVKRATEAFRDNKEDIIAQGQKLLEDPDSAVEKGREMAADQGLREQVAGAAADLVGEEAVAQAQAQAEEVIGSDEAKQAAAQLAEDAASAATDTPANDATANSTAMAKPGADPNAGRVQSFVPPIPLGQDDMVPVPKDPVMAQLPRPGRDAKKMTRITAEKSQFDSNTNKVKFEDNVTLDHPEFDLSCDILEADLKGDEKAKTGGMSPTQRAAVGGIQRAVAKGYVQIEKISADGKPQVAKSRLAIYEADTGDVTLSDFPILQDGENLIRGKSEATKIYLRQNGKYDVDGPADYEFVNKNNALEITPRPGGN